MTFYYNYNSNEHVYKSIFIKKLKKNQLVDFILFLISNMARKDSETGSKRSGKDKRQATFDKFGKTTIRHVRKYEAQMAIHINSKAVVEQSQ
jgi:hypothetical protein